MEGRGTGVRKAKRRGWLKNKKDKDKIYTTLPSKKENTLLTRNRTSSPTYYPEIGKGGGGRITGEIRSAGAKWG